MAATVLLNNKVTTINLVFENGAGTVVSAPAGDSFTAVSSAPASLGVAIGGNASSPTLVLTPLVQAGVGYTVTVNDTKGIAPSVVTFNITPDPSIPTQLVLGFVNTVAQAIPVAPGP